MPPEAVLLIVNACFLAFAYLFAYPAMKEKTAEALAKGDLAITGAALLVAGLLYWGSGQRFDLILFQANWFVFSLLTLMAMELPLFLWFCRRHGISLTPPPG
ncbi:hypothetical protein E7811_00020 [Aliigemmobacter aestuarii]|uniref:DUF2818 family protein n=1 Tax=Aliigemmobacter aestuarii TaxID=1445661 RepID=A0A4S3MPB8_9RHOB|nr:hypothetical protein [Gemmobacter aestuarii]THD84187.1 hypothetical protein E7811_00020 [Gemmobacter aestuarii]